MAEKIPPLEVSKEPAAQAPEVAFDGHDASAPNPNVPQKSRGLDEEQWPV